MELENIAMYIKIASGVDKESYISGMQMMLAVMDKNGKEADPNHEETIIIESHCCNSKLEINKYNFPRDDVKCGCGKNYLLKYGQKT